MTAIAWLAPLLLGLCFTGCVPWTVRPIESLHESSRQAMTPAAYVDSVWESKLVPEFRAHAVEARELLNALAISPEQAAARWGRRQGTGATYFIVKGTGRLLRLDTGSRIGIASVDVPPLDGKADLTIQTGPVLRGVALRDATGLIPFSDFANQIQFADVANELNARVLRTVLPRLAADTRPATPLTFLGAVEMESNATPPLRWLVPLALETGAGTK